MPSYYTGSVNIGSSRALPLFGYGERRSEAASDQAALEANWLYIADATRSVLMLSLDTLYSSNAFEEALRASLAKAGATVPAIFAVASHTHYAPALDPMKPALGAADEDHTAEIAERIAAALLQAVKHGPTFVPSRWSYSARPVPKAIFRRAKRLTVSVREPPFIRFSTQIAPNPKVQVDTDLRLWMAHGADDTPLFSLVSWPCHTTSRDRTDVASADFVGPLRNAIRSSTKGPIPVFFFPGTSGDVRPDFSGYRIGRRLFYPYPLQRSFQQPSVQRVSAFDTILTTAARSCVDSPDETFSFGFNDYACTELAHTDFLKDAGSAQTRVRRLLLGGIEVLGFGAEISALWPKLLDLDGVQSHRIVSGCVGDCFGYLPTDSQVSEGGYEVVGFRRSFGLKGRYNSKVPIRPALIAALDRVRGEASE